MPIAATTLRVLVEAPPEAGVAAEWALFDSANRVLRRGKDRPSAWPAADRREAVIAAAHGRLATVSVPPLPPARASAAARFALEDQLADVPEASHVALAPQALDGSVRTAIVADDWMRAFAAGSKRCDIEWDRALLECDLATAAPGVWRWCAESVNDAGFVRTDNGATIGVGPASADVPPGELVLALAGAGDRAPANVRVDAAGASPALLAHARKETRVEFVPGATWRWTDASPAAFAGAIDLLSGNYGASPRAGATDFVRLLRPALRVAAIAIGVAVIASVGEWVWLRWQSASTEREMETIAKGAVPDYSVEAAGGVTPAVVLQRRERELKHRAGLAARDDFVPLLARAAPALATLPAGALRGLAYGDGHIVLELQKLDAAQTSRIQRELQQTGLIAIAAPTASGARLRIGLN
jgi:general secretion pathway protein L